MKRAHLRAGRTLAFKQLSALGPAGTSAQRAGSTTSAAAAQSQIVALLGFNLPSGVSDLN